MDALKENMQRVVVTRRKLLRVRVRQMICSKMSCQKK